MRTIILKPSSLCDLCPYSLNIDLYTGCNHNCAYCFANGSVSALYRKNIEPINYKNQLENVNKGIETYGKYLIKNGQPIHVGGNTDPFPHGIEEKLGHTKGFLEYVKNTDLKFIISTKNPLYPELFTDNIIIQTSISGFGNKFNRLENGTITNEERLRQLDKFNGRAHKTIVRMQPFIPAYYDRNSLEAFIKEVAQVADGLTVEFLFLNSKQKFDYRMDDAIKHLKSRCIVRDTDYRYTQNYMFSWVDTFKELCYKYNLELYFGEDCLRQYGKSVYCCGVTYDDVKFKSIMDLNSGKILKILLESKKPVFIDEYLDSIKYLSRFKMNETNLNTGNALKAKRYAVISLYKYVEDMLMTNKSSNPANLYYGVKLTEIDGRLAFVLKEEASCNED